jgi:hypothetical protein
MKRVTLHRSRPAVASAIVVLTATFGALVACADSAIIGNENTTADGGAFVPPVIEAGSEEIEAGDLPDAGSDVDAATRLCSTDGFCPTALPKGQSLLGVWGDGTGVVWALSTQGNILRWDGSAWAMHHRAQAEGFSIWGSGPTDVWVATAAGVLHGEGPTSASLTFSVVDLPGDPNIPLRSVWGTGPADIWAVGMLEDQEMWPPAYYGRAVHFGGSETGWTADDELASLGIGFRGVWGSPGTGVWIDGLGSDEVETFVRVVRRTPGADAWSVVDLQAGAAYPTAIHGAALSSDSTVLLSGLSGVIEEAVKTTWRGTSSDNGRTFQWSFAKHEYWKRDFLAYWGTGPNDTWGVGAYGLVSHWDGTTWTQAILRVSDVPIGKTFRAIWGKSNDDFWVVGDEVALHKTNQGKP